MSNSTATVKEFTRLTLILAIVAGLAFASGPFSSIDLAAQDESGRVCGNHTLRGDYGLLASGIRRVPPFLGGGTEQFSATAMWTFHGDGTFTQGLGAALRGQVTGTQPSGGEIPGTYSVNANCTGTLALFVPELPFPIEYAIVVVDNAHEVKGIITSDTSITTVALTRK